MNPHSPRSGRQTFACAPRSVARVRGLGAQSPMFPGLRAPALHPGLYAAARLRGLKSGSHVSCKDLGNDKGLKPCHYPNLFVFVPEARRILAGGGALAEPPERPSLLRLRSGRSAGQVIMRRRFRMPSPVQHPCRGALSCRLATGGSAGASLPANIHCPSRAKSSTRSTQKIWVMTRYKWEVFVFEKMQDH